MSTPQRVGGTRRTGAANPAVGPDEPAEADAAVRASDAERAETVGRLHQALGAGRLTLDETDERVVAAYAARQRRELSALLTDLPETDVAFSAAPPWGGLWMLAVWRVRTWAGGGAATERPTAAQLRTAALLAALTAVWVVACAVLGALVVGA